MRTSVIVWVSVEGVPRHRVPAGLVGSLALDRFVDEPFLEQLSFCPSDYVRTLPTPLAMQVRPRAQQTPVVVTAQLASHLEKQRLRRMAQTGVGGAVEDRPWQSQERSAVAS